VKFIEKKTKKVHPSHKSGEVEGKKQDAVSFEAAKKKKIKKEIIKATKKKMIEKNKKILKALKKIGGNIDKLAKKKMKKEQKVKPKVQN